jgi:DNA-binding NarL/FixJ family response regulator
MIETAAAPQPAALMRVFLVDDHPVVREGLAQLIDAETDMRTCGQAQSATLARNALTATPADVAVIDISLEDGSGMDLIRDIRERFPTTRVLVFSMHRESLYAERAIRAGAMGYVMKGADPSSVIAAIRRVAAGDISLSAETNQRILRRMANHCDHGETDLAALTDREMEIFHMLGSGLAPKEAAVRLHLSRKTVEAHRENIKKKLKCSTSAQLLQLATRAVESAAG